LSRALIADARAVAARWPDARPRMLAELAAVVTEAPWALSRDHHDRARAAGVSDEELLHAIALASYFGHLNRIADAVAVPLDYEVQQIPPHAEPATPRLVPAPVQLRGTPALGIESRPATAAALTEWREYLLARDPANRQVAGWVARLLGDGDGSGGGSGSGNGSGNGDGSGSGGGNGNGNGSGPAAGDEARYRLVEQVSLAPWQLGDASFAELRAAGYDDARLFDLCAAASSFGVFSRLRVALIALGR
jgi:alkylhydroperoxidase family enzyme